MKLRAKIILVSIITCILPLCLLFFWMSMALQEDAVKQGQEFCYFHAENLESLLNQAFDSAYDASLSVIANRPIREYLTCDWKNAPQPELIALQENARNALYTIAGNNTYISSMNIFSMDNRQLSWGRTGKLYQTEISRALEYNGRYFWGIDNSGNMKGQPYLCRLLRDDQQVGIHWGYAKIYLYADKIEELLSSLDTNHYIRSTLQNPDGEILFPREEPSSNAVDEYFEERSLTHTDWRLTTCLNANYSLDASQLLLDILYIGLLLALFALAILTVVLSHMLIKPIHRISETMGAVGSGEFGTHLELHRKDEIGMLSHQLNHMSDELQRLFDEAVSNHTMFIEAKLNALQSQVNPHFLYNTLDNVYWMSEMHHEHEISHMIASLSKLFRLALSTDKTGIWPLSKEIEHVRCYMDILNVRFRDTVEFSFLLQEGLENINVPSLMLQPLIENAVQHGIRDVEHGKVQVDIHAEGDRMIYRVLDNGVADAEYINHLIQNGPEPGSRKGQALNNLYQRVTLRFGQNAAFYCVSTPDGSLFELNLPIDEKGARA